MNRIVEQGGQKYAIIGDKAVPVTISETGDATIEVAAKEIKYPDGRQDVVISVPCLKVAGATKG